MDYYLAIQKKKKNKKQIIDICYFDGSEMLKKKGHVLSEHICIEFPEKENL